MSHHRCSSTHYALQSFSLDSSRNIHPTRETSHYLAIETGFNARMYSIHIDITCSMHSVPHIVHHVIPHQHSNSLKEQQIHHS